MVGRNDDAVDVPRARSTAAAAAVEGFSGSRAATRSRLALLDRARTAVFDDLGWLEGDASREVPGEVLPRWGLVPRLLCDLFTVADDLIDSSEPVGFLGGGRVWLRPSAASAATPSEPARTTWLLDGSISNGEGQGRPKPFDERACAISQRNPFTICLSSLPGTIGAALRWAGHMQSTSDTKYRTEHK